MFSILTLSKEAEDEEGGLRGSALALSLTFKVHTRYLEKSVGAFGSGAILPPPHLEPSHSCVLHFR